MAYKKRGILPSLRIGGSKIKEVLLRLDAGDFIKEYPSQRIFLHTSDLQNRFSIELAKSTVNAMLIRGLVMPNKSKDGIDYQLTDDGQVVANIFAGRTMLHE
jgi:hypothetical protein